MTAMCCSTLSEHLHRGYGWRSVQIKPKLSFKIMSCFYMMDNLKHVSRLVFSGPLFSSSIPHLTSGKPFIQWQFTVPENAQISLIILVHYWNVFCWKLPERTPGNFFLPKLLCEYNWMEQWRNFQLNKWDTFSVFLFRVCVLTFQYWDVRSVEPGWDCRRVRVEYTACSSRACAGRWDSSWLGAASVSSSPSSSQRRCCCCSEDCSLLYCTRNALHDQLNHLKIFLLNNVIVIRTF